MTNIAKEAYHTATNITRIYTRLGVARDVLALALDEAPLGFDDAQFKRINDLRNTISSEMALINDFSKREAHRLCHPEETEFPQFYISEQWNDDTAFIRFDSADTLGVAFDTAGNAMPPCPEFKFSAIKEWIFWHKWERVSQERALARITPTPPVHECPEIGPCPYCEPMFEPPFPTPADSEQVNLDPLSMPVMDSGPILPPDPVFMQVDSPGLPITFLQLDQSRTSNPPRVTAAKLPIGGLGGV